MLSPNISPELAEICGIHAGDGYMRTRERNRGEVQISGNIEEKDYYDNHVIPLINSIFKLNIKGKFFRKNLYGFITHNKEVRETLLNLGFPSGRKSINVRVPKIILASKNPLLYVRFLRGLLDTDGHIGFRKCYGKYTLFKTKRHHYPIIHITTISKRLAKDVCFILKFLKIKYFIHSFQPKDPEDKFKYRIIMNGVERMNKWMDLIGSKNSVKLTRYLIWRRFGFCPTNLTLQQREGILKGELDIYSIEGL